MSFSGEMEWGDLVVHKEAVSSLKAIFRTMLLEGFPLEKMRLIEEYDGSDERSAADNNTSAFNCRNITGKSDRWSRHAYGRAIDINPVQNPYIKGELLVPEAGAAYRDRSKRRAGMILRPGPVYRAFKKRGWRWGGDWRSLKDYQHFELR